MRALRRRRCARRWGEGRARGLLGAAGAASRHAQIELHSRGVGFVPLGKGFPG